MKNIQRFLNILLPSVLFVLAPCRISAETSGPYTYTVSEDKATITACPRGYQGTFAIPI